MFETAIVTYPSAWSQEMVSLLKKVRQEKECWKEAKKGSAHPGLWVRSQDVVRVTPICRMVVVTIFKYMAFLVQPTSAFGCPKAFSNSSCSKHNS